MRSFQLLEYVCFMVYNHDNQKERNVFVLMYVFGPNTSPVSDWSVHIFAIASIDVFIRKWAITWFDQWEPITEKVLLSRAASCFIVRKLTFYRPSCLYRL